MRMRASAERQLAWAHQIWWREIENSRKLTILLKAISLVLWISYFPTKNVLHDKNRTFSKRDFSAVGFLDLLKTLKTQRQKSLFLYKSDFHYFVGKRQFVLILSSHSSLIWTWQRNFAPLNGLANPRPGRSYLSLSRYFVASNYVGALVLVLLNYQLRWCDILFSTAH